MNSTLLEIAEIFGQSFGVHRVNIVDDSGRVNGIISQSDIGRFLLSKVSSATTDLFRLNFI